MIKKLAASWVIALSTVFVIPMLANADPLVHDQGLSLLQELSHQLNSPDDIAQYIWRNFSFEKDQRQFGMKEYWQTPEELLNTRKGDCEDYAVFANSLLKMNGYKSFLLNVYGSRFAHTVCVFEENGKYNVIDGTRVLRYEADDLTEMSDRIYPFWKTAAIVKPSKISSTGSILAKFEKMTRAQRQLAQSA